jgi:type I restriction enzyme M protein
MLDNETKRRIDTARDILVGKLPDPKSQVEQITIALIYKFMDDMDAQSVEYGGEPSFFVGDYEKYGWRKIFAPDIGGHELLALYGEAITTLNQNPNLPQLFRDVFKNAFLPYRDPETLKLFLKTINEFKYDHSERLGDAFEYLLSVLGSQGDAGQFRTPRHIIDFIVEVVQPRKEDTVCDPACGTAGFLISSYKHILRNNTRAQNGDMLTPDDRKRLMQNVVGYDISPDMVRLSLVNLYLHGFPDPHIYEYDTLTSEDRWNESFDVVMANPPFMSPKGGIKPHKKFSLQANRSEVLFVDYIAEHINPVSGRAGVIVPEGIIFQSANAYKDLRKMLVEKAFLYAVVSLPAGVFNPYSGVKTSILFFDKTLAAKSDKILFVKIADDGFDLGAQRKQLKTSDLPRALNVVLDFQKAILHGDTSRFENIEELPSLAIAVEKSTIATNGDFNLSGDRYRASIIHRSKFEFVELGDTKLFHVESGGTPDTNNPDYWNGDIKWATLVDLPAKDFITEIYDTERKISEEGLRGSSAKLIPENSVVVSSRATIGRIGINRVPIATNQGFKNVIIKDEARASTKFVALMLTMLKDEMELKASGGTFKEISKTNFCSLKIPLPPLSVQKEIVERVEGYQRLIDGAKKVVQSFKPNINLNPGWQIVELGDVCKFIGGYAFKSEDLTNEHRENHLPVIKIGNLNREGGLNLKDVQFHPFEQTLSKYLIKDKDILIAMTGATVGKVAVSNQDNLLLNQRVGLVRANEEKLNRDLLKRLLLGESFYIYCQNTAGGGAQGNISPTEILKFKIPLPPPEEQEQLVAQIEREQSLVNATRELITIYEQKIKDEIKKLWEQ